MFNLLGEWRTYEKNNFHKYFVDNNSLLHVVANKIERFCRYDIDTPSTRRLTSRSNSLIFCLCCSHKKSFMKNEYTMGFSCAALPFLVYAIIQGYLFVEQCKYYQNGQKVDEDVRAWQLARLFNCVGLFFVVLDNVRRFCGGFWNPAPNTAPPKLANLIYPATVAHLVMVPLLIYNQGEVAFASYTEEDIWWSLAALTVAIGFAIPGAINASSQIKAGHIDGLQQTVSFGVVEYTFPTAQRAKQLDLPFIGTELTGVLAFSAAAIVAGGVVWSQGQGSWYFWLAMAGTIGQGIGPMFKPWYFFYMSNFFEIVSFGALVLADKWLFVN